MKLSLKREGLADQLKVVDKDITKARSSSSRRATRK